MSKDIKAILKATGEEILVYKHRNGGFVNSSDMTTKYTKEQVILKTNH